MKRREFLGLLGTAALISPRPGYAQTKSELPVVAVLMISNPETNIAKDRVAALRKGLQEAGFAEGDINRLPEFARELGKLNPTRLRHAI